jgi:hypothetical protein
MELVNKATGIYQIPAIAAPDDSSIPFVVHSNEFACQIGECPAESAQELARHWRISRCTCLHSGRANRRSTLDRGK